MDTVWLCCRGMFLWIPWWSRFLHCRFDRSKSVVPLVSRRILIVISEMKRTEGETDKLFPLRFHFYGLHTNNKLQGSLCCNAESWLRLRTTYWDNYFVRYHFKHFSYSLMLFVLCRIQMRVKKPTQRKYLWKCGGLLKLRYSVSGINGCDLISSKVRLWVTNRRINSLDA
jgi:hypothetical protein